MRDAAERYSNSGTERESNGSQRSAAAKIQLPSGGWNLRADTLLDAAGSTASKRFGKLASSSPFNRHRASGSANVADCKATIPGTKVSTSKRGESDAARSRMGNTSFGWWAASCNSLASSTTVTTSLFFCGLAAPRFFLQRRGSPSGLACDERPDFSILRATSVGVFARTVAASLHEPPVADGLARRASSE